MTTVFGIPSAASNAASLVSSNKPVDDTEGHGPLSVDSDSAGYLGEDESSGKKFKHSAGVQFLTQKPTSDTCLCERARSADAAAGLQFSSLSRNAALSPKVGLRPPRIKGRRSSSNSQIETRSQGGGMASLETAGQRQIIARLNNIKRSDVLQRSKRQLRSGASSLTAEDEEYKNPQKWRLSRHSNSDPDFHLSSVASSRPDAKKPLKTCLKHKAQSASATPDHKATLSNKSLAKQLRRVKTVDFERTTPEPFSFQRKAPGSTADDRRSRARRTPGRAYACPGASYLAKHSPACPAVTRTDVHAIAIAPFRSRYADLGTTYQGDHGGVSSATPTMQIVEPGSGSYEVVWDDVPPENSTRIRRSSSSASQALEGASTSTRGLERVNTKLTEWSGTWNTPSDSFKPTIVVFPDDDGRGPHFECAIVNDNELEIFAPPNSERVSAVHSRCPSRPISARMSRATSQEEFNGQVLPQDVQFDQSTASMEAALLVPDPEAWSAHLVASRRKLGVPNPERKLSNVEEADFRFRTHRDSVTLAHSRLVKSSGVRPELFAHRDSVTIAKKRMHANNHQHAHRQESKSEPRRQTEIEAARIPPLPVVKAHAVEALRNGTPTPILCQPKSASGRHIQIEESR